MTGTISTPTTTVVTTTTTTSVTNELPTGVVNSRVVAGQKQQNQNKQVLDNLEVERRRGITVKAQTASMFYNYGSDAVVEGEEEKEGEEFLLNLIDTPVTNFHFFTFSYFHNFI